MLGPGVISITSAVIAKASSGLISFTTPSLQKR
jgi:hypothetical protein